jgi:predicted 2-oxoglutarate/Fe(II)-dependent dioxygenase YbiX
MDKLIDYVKKYKLVDSDLCDNILEDIKKTQWVPHMYQSPDGKEESKNGDQELYVNNSQSKYHSDIMSCVWKSYQSYLRELQMPWYDTWHGFSPVRYNRYSNNQIMSKHCDHIHSLFGGNNGIPIMTALGSLNDEYQGGEFIMFDDIEIKINKGEILVFPSNYLYPHRVMPVTSGERYTFVAWAW